MVRKKLYGTEGAVQLKTYVAQRVRGSRGTLPFISDRIKPKMDGKMP